ncbi:DUF1328 domain-containing protein [Salinimicrobium sp. GXAS 041]|uniref:DUF1328 domain-containing protein n=1 Tax=Salinimicrobium sp. GXAS 041 TaxID=3400806 RepID=UPI003C73C5B7
MKIFTLLFLIIALVTGFISFTGMNYEGIEVMRVLCFVFTDLFMISLFAKVLFPNNLRLRQQKVKK